MIRFSAFEQAGPIRAAMSDKRDGDCGSSDEAHAATTIYLEKLGIRPEQLLRLRQVHGARIVDAADFISQPPGTPPEADGWITNRPGVALGVCVADCAPVLLYNPVVKAVAAIHAGREGVIQNIVAAGISALRAQYGGFAHQLLALVGPHAGACCYEVSREMAVKWQTSGLPAWGRRLDLAEAIRIQLENTGVIRHNIQVVPHCTVCGGGFFSYRADKTSQRNLVVVML